MTGLVPGVGTRVGIVAEHRQRAGRGKLGRGSFFFYIFFRVRVQAARAKDSRFRWQLSHIPWLPFATRQHPDPSSEKWAVSVVASLSPVGAAIGVAVGVSVGVTVVGDACTGASGPVGCKCSQTGVTFGQSTTECNVTTEEVRSRRVQHTPKQNAGVFQFSPPMEPKEGSIVGFAHRGTRSGPSCGIYGAATWGAGHLRWAMWSAS